MRTVFLECSIAEDKAAALWLAAIREPVLAWESNDSRWIPDALLGCRDRRLRTGPP